MHTSTPWSEDFEKGSGQITHRASGMTVAMCSLPNDGTPYGTMRETRYDNAVFIVEAVNNHARLKSQRDAFLKALRDADLLLDPGDYKDWEERRKCIKEALALAEGGKEKA